MGWTVRFGTVALALLLWLPGATWAAPKPFPTGTDGDYQLGGVRAVPAGVGTVVRDRSAAPVPGRYNVCYVNGFQTQPHESAFWRGRADLILRTRTGTPVVDQAWGEKLLDIRTAAKRARLAAVVGRWIEGCARSGFDAVELDNLDSFARSRGLVPPSANKAFARLLVARAHRAGLAVAQKNWAEWNGRSVGFDFAIAEECGRYDECGSYARNYQGRVLVVEYRAVDFAATCERWGSRLAVVLRDRGLTSAGLRRFC